MESGGTGYPISFDCWVCRLALLDDELDAFDFPKSVELPEEDDEEPWRTWRYDDDDEQRLRTLDNGD